MEDHQHHNHPLPPQHPCISHTTSYPTSTTCCPTSITRPNTTIVLVSFQTGICRKTKDAEAHLLRTNDWMDTHASPEGVKVHRFYITLVAEARLWYESLRPIAIDWNCLQTQFRQQYSKTGNTGEQLILAQRSFHFNEYSETLDSYVTCIRQVAVLLGY